MKRLLSYAAIILSLFVILIIINKAADNENNKIYAESAQKLYQTTPDKLNPATRELLDNPNYQNIILPDQLKQKLENNESLFVYFFSPICQFCQATTPKLNTIAQEMDVEIHQFNVLEFPNDLSAYNIQSWPTLVYYKDGVEHENSRIEGGFSPDANEETDALVEAGYRAFIETMKLQ